MKQIMVWFGTLEQHTAGGNKEGGSNFALEPAGPEAELQPGVLTTLLPTELFPATETVPRGVVPLFKVPSSLLPVYYCNIIMCVTSIDLLHFHWSSQTVSSGKALANRDMMTPIRLHWYSNAPWIYEAHAAPSHWFWLVIYPLVTLSQKSLNVMLINYLSLTKHAN